jgi:hypothetical protein
MGALDWVKALLGKGLVEPIVQYYTRKQELKQARFDAQLKAEEATGERRAQLIRDGLAADANWEMAFAQQAASSWKDEYTLIVVSIPAILAFVRIGPFDGPAIVKDGFAALSATPLWYQGLLLSLFLATVGIRYWRRSQSDT